MKTPCQHTVGKIQLFKKWHDPPAEFAGANGPFESCAAVKTAISVRRWNLRQEPQKFKLVKTSARVNRGSWVRIPPDTTVEHFFFIMGGRKALVMQS